MKTSLVLGALMIVGVATIRSAFGDDWKNESGQEWWRRGEWKEEFWDGPCRVKREAKRGEFKEAIKCKDGAGAHWQGERKEEFWDGPCRVKIEAKRREYQKEVKCERNN